MPRTETFTLYKKRKEALATTRIGHIEKEYDLITDEVDENGVRVIRMKPKVSTELAKLRNELADKIMEKLGETSKMLRKLLLDTLNDYNDASIKRMHRKVVLGIAPVKATKGCFEIIIGDGRKKSSDTIRIRE